MYDTPVSLQDCCVDFICENITALCEEQPSNQEEQNKLVFKDRDAFFHSNISDQLLSTLAERGKLTDSTLLLFDSSVSCLKRVCIRNAPNLSSHGLRIFKSHKISELEATGLKTVSVNDLIGCLGEWSLSNLRTLNVTNSTFYHHAYSAKFCVVVGLSKLKNLQTLNVSYTDFNTHALEIVIQDLPSLESLDISNTSVHDISALKPTKRRLKYLSMYNVKAAQGEEFVSVISEMENLRHLDISEDGTVSSALADLGRHRDILDLLCCEDALPRLESLDISGQSGLTEGMLRDFLENHPHLKFLGLSLTDVCDMPEFVDKEHTACPTNMVITGEATESQIKEALKRYYQRHVYVQKSLYNLFAFSQEISEPRVDLIELILPGMRSHPKQLGVQMAATACLYNLTKSEMGLKIGPVCLRKVVQLTLDAMENFPSHQQLQKNTLLTLCSDRILQDITFDRYRCARLVMECLCTFDDASMNRMAVAICSILAAKIPTEQTSQLGTKQRYMKKLLSIVKTKAENHQVDITMKFSLSALWNLTDESPSTCSMFVSQGGLELFMSVVEIYKTTPDEQRVQVETKVLGLLNNIAEVEGLRGVLMKEEFLESQRHLLKSSHIEVSYFAAGVVAHLVSVNSLWEGRMDLRAQIVLELGNAVENWVKPQNEMVAYRSFCPFFPLLKCDHLPEVQLWAVWAMHHVCSKNAGRYCGMLVEEKGSDLLKNIVRNPAADERVVKIAKEILELAKVKSVQD